MKREWLRFAKQLTMEPADFKSGSKKIIRHRKLNIRRFDDPVDMYEIGYQGTKLSLLKKLYVHEESLSSAVDQWKDRVEGGRYGSVGFSCYNHILKPHSGESANHRASTMGPCLQAMTVTQIPGEGAALDVFYRTTEILKKFPADLVLIQRVFMERFDWSVTKPVQLTCHFSNITVSSNYISVLLTVMEDDPIDYLEELAEADSSFHRSSMIWLGKTLSGKYDKFNQARRNANATRRLMSEERKKRLASYIQSLRLPHLQETQDEDEE